ncbi:MAG: hypothetical protein ACC651_08955 [Candidatus Scalindua sp.]
MNDTEPKIEEKIKELMKKKTPEDRLKMGCSMFSFSKTIIQASLQGTENIQLSDLKKKLFLRLYGKEMDEDTRKKIAAYFSSSKSKKSLTNE